MTLRLIRREFREDGIFSELLNEKSKVLAQTAEHAYNSQPKLPFGTYTCRRGIHKLHDLKPFETFEICGVPGHTGVLFHIGNWPQIDSDGCCLLGGGIAPSSKGQMLTNSKATFEEFMQSMVGTDSFSLIVSD